MSTNNETNETLDQNQGASCDGDTDYQNEANQQDEQTNETDNGQIRETPDCDGEEETPLMAHENDDTSRAVGMAAPNGDGTGIMDPDDPRIGEADEDGGVGAQIGDDNGSTNF